MRTELRVSPWFAAVCALGAGCRRDPGPGPDLQIVGESTRVRAESPVPETSPWFDGTTVSLIGARGETLGIQVLHRDQKPTGLTFSDPAITVRGYTVEAKIPWASFSKALKSPPAVGDAWRMNFYAMKNNGGVAWSPILGMGNFHRASRFGRVRWNAETASR